MLERRQFTLTARLAGPGLARAVAVADGVTGEPVGAAREEHVSPPAAALRWAGLGRLLPAEVVVREGPDGSHLFTLARRAYLSGPHFFVADSQDDPVGTVSGGTLRDAGGRPVAAVRGDRAGARFRLAGKADTLATVTRRRGPGWRPTAVTAVALSPATDGLPFLKMLLLAAALSLDMVLPPPPRRPEEFPC